MIGSAAATGCSLIVLLGCARVGAPSPSQPTPAASVFPGDPPTSAQPPVQDAGACSSVCARAQLECRTHTPKPVSYCESKCRSAAEAVAGTSLQDLAIMFTCDEEPR